MGVSTIHSIYGKDAAVFSFKTREVVPVETVDPDECKSREGLQEFNKKIERIIGKGDLRYTYFQCPSLDVSSRNEVMLGIGSMSAFADRDFAAENIVRRPWPDVKIGAVTLLRTLDGKYAIIRIEEFNADSITFQWAYQPDGSAVFPKLKPIIEEKQPPPPTNKEINFELLKLVECSSKLSKEKVVSEFQRLIRAGADVNTRPVTTTPLSLAAEMGSLEMVKLLIEAGADMDESNALINAIDYGRYDIFKYLVEQGADIIMETESEWTPIQAALRAEVKNDEIIKYLKEHGADEASLHVAVDINNIEGVKKLIKNGADVNAHGERGLTPLHIAAKKGNTNMCKLLLELGADTSLERNGECIIALELAVDSGDLDTVKVLLEKASFVEKSKGLYNAISKHNPEILKMILSSVENPLALIKHDGEMLDYYVVRFIRHDEMKILMENGLEVQLWTAARFGMLEIIDKHIKSGMAVDSLSPDDIPEHALTPLQLAVEADQVNAAKLLLEYGANPNVIDEPRGATTPLRWAVEKGNAAMVSLLLSHGAIVGKDMEYDDNLLVNAVVYDRYEIVELLLKAGANPNYPPKDGYDETLLEEAHDAKMKKILEKYGAK